MEAAVRGVQWKRRTSAPLARTRWLGPGSSFWRTAARGCMIRRECERTKEETVIELSARQLDIVQYVKQNAPITGEQIAEWLGLSRPTIRSDLALLVMLGYLDAKPKVGYFLGKAADQQRRETSLLFELKVKDVQSLPVIIKENATVQDAVVTLFLENVGSLIVTGQDGQLAGMVSRKDLLKVTLGNAGAPQMPVSLVMTRQPNIATVGPEETVLDAARKMIQHEVDTLPVIDADPDHPGTGRQAVVGRMTKTTLTKVLLSLAGGVGGL